MGRQIKQYKYNTTYINSLSAQERIDLYQNFQHLYYFSLSEGIKTVRLPLGTIHNAILYYLSEGFEVFTKDLSEGYPIGANELRSDDLFIPYSKKGRKVQERISHLLPLSDMPLFATATEDNVACPTLMLVKAGVVSFVEVSHNPYIHPLRVGFAIRYGHKWPMSILLLEPFSKSTYKTLEDYTDKPEVFTLSPGTIIDPLV